YLNAHPEVRRPLRKEIDYFSVDYGRGESWYRSHFPLRSAEQRSYDCTPQYFVHPLAPERCHKLLPDVRLVVSVRDPIERAISQYHHMRSLGFESLDLLDALRAEPERIADDLAAVMADDRHRPTTYLRFNYVERSRYGAQMSRWLDWYGLSSIHFFDFERFTADPEPEWRSLLRFLGLRPWDPPDFRNWTPTDARPAPDGEAISFLRAELA